MYALWNTGTASTTYKQLTFPAAIARDNSSTATNFNITYNANGGSSTPSTQTGTKTVVTKYTFNGWHEGSATGTSHAASSTWNPTGAKTIYAGWNSSTASTTYKEITLASAITKSASVSTTTLTTSYHVNGGNSTTPSSQTSTRTNTTPQNFNGWHEGSATGTSHAAGSK